MKKLTLLAASVLMLTSCGGANAEQQNFIKDTNYKLIPGSVALSLTTQAKIDEQWKDFEKNLPAGTTVEQKEAYKVDIQRTSGTQLATIVYDEDTLGSYTYSFDMKAVFGDYLTADGEHLRSDVYLNVFFAPYGNTYRSAKFSYSTFKIEVSYTYTEPDHDPIEFTEEMSASKVDVTTTRNFYNNFILNKYSIGRIKNFLHNVEYVSNAKFTFSGAIGVTIKDK